MWLGLIFAAGAGLLISTGIYVGRFWLARFFSDTPEVQELTAAVGGQVSLYYFLNSLMWGAWAPLEGQMRTTIPMLSMTAGMWLITVPLTFATVKFGWLGVRQTGVTCYKDATLNPDPSACPNNKLEGPAYEQLNASWWVGNIGMFFCFFIMLVACLTADWNKLAIEAQEQAELVEDDGAGKDSLDESLVDNLVSTK